MLKYETKFKRNSTSRSDVSCDVLRQAEVSSDSAKKGHGKTRVNHNWECT